MKYRKLTSFLLPFLSTAFVALGFGACKSSKKIIEEQRQQKVQEADLKAMRLDAEISDTHAKRQNLIRMKEELTRAKCVYGGPNMMENRSLRVDPDLEKAEEVQKDIDRLERAIDSLEYEKGRVYTELSKDLEELNRK